jgi:hypothetical protein
VGLRQGEILPRVPFSLFIEDNYLQRNIHDGIDMDHVTLFLLLFADDVVRNKSNGVKKGKQPQGLVLTYCNTTIEMVSQFT